MGGQNNFEMLDLCALKSFSVDPDLSSYPVEWICRCVIKHNGCIYSIFEGNLKHMTSCVNLSPALKVSTH